MNGRNPTPQRLGRGDLAAVLALDRRALGGFWSPSQWGSELSAPRHVVLGLWHSADLVAIAAAALVVDELHISLVATDPDHRRRGLGRRVLAALLQQGLAHGAMHATLEVATGNTEAQGLYASLGFRSAGIRRGYYRNGDDALIQWLRIQPAQGMER